MRRKAPFPGKICARCIPERRFAALFGYMARISCQSQRRFSRPRPLQGYMKREYCRGWPPMDAPRRNIAAVGRWGRNSRASCHRRALRNAPGHNLATTGRPRRTPHAPRPHGSRSAHGAERPPRPMFPRARRSFPAPPAAAPRRHAPYAALLPPLKK